MMPESREFTETLTLVDAGQQAQAMASVARLASGPDAALAPALTALIEGRYADAACTWSSAIGAAEPTAAGRLLGWRILAVIGHGERDAASSVIAAMLRERAEADVNWTPALCRLLLSVKHNNPSTFAWLCGLIHDQLATRLASEAYRSCAEHVALVAQYPLAEDKLTAIVDRALDEHWSLSKTSNHLCSYSVPAFMMLRQRLALREAEVDRLRAEGQPPDWARLFELMMIAAAVDEATWRRFLARIRTAETTAPRPSAPTNTPEGIVRRMAKLDGEQPSVPSAAGRPLRIAVCVSGQLRGYREAHATWDALGLDQHDTSFFVHTWREIGAKTPNPSHAYRVFSDGFLEAWLRECALQDFRAIERSYPTLFREIGRSGRIDAKRMREEYDARHVVVQDERAPPQRGKSNSWKMYFKIRKAWEIAARHAKQPFDLVVRVRPDKEVRPASAPNWRAIHDICRTERVVFGTSEFDLHDGVGFIIDDQVAIAIPEIMDAYTRAYERTLESARNQWHAFPAHHLPHTNLAYTLAYDAIRARRTPGVAFGSHFDIGKPSPRDIEAWLRKDIGKQPRNDTDVRLLAAIMQDVAVLPTSASGRAETQRVVVPH